MWSTHEIHEQFATYVGYSISYSPYLLQGSMITLCRTADSLKRYMHKVYMLTAHSAVVTTVNSTKCAKRAKYIILKNLLSKIVRHKHIQYYQMRA